MAHAWALSSGFLPLAQATGGCGRFAELPDLNRSLGPGTGSPVENSRTVKCQGIYLSVPEILISLLKKNTTHLANRRSGKNVLLDKHPEWLLRMLEMMNCAEKKCLWQIVSRLYLGGSKARGPANRAHTALLFVFVYL